MKRYDTFAGILVAVLLAGGMLAGCGKESGSVTQNTVTSGNHVMETEQEKATEPMKVPSSDDVQETHKESVENGEETKADGVEETTMALTDTGISPDGAKDIALEDAGFTENEVGGVYVRREYKGKTEIYKVEFYVQNKEYDYEIDAYSKEILSVDFDIDDDYYYPGATQAASSTEQQEGIGIEEATQLVLAKVPGATEENVRIKQEWDDGKLLYEGDVYYDQKEYEFEMDASTGDFLEWSEESIYH